MKKFNINDHMYVQITEAGWAHIRKTLSDTKYITIDPEKYIEHCIENRKVEIDGEIWYKLQCHDVFDLMPMNCGGPILFNTNVMFDDEDLK